MSKKKHVWILTALAVVIYSAISWLVPYQLDDIFYMDWLRVSSDGYFGFAGSHWLHQNGRLGNLLCPLLLCYLPKWLFALLTGACVGGLLVFSYKLGVRHAGVDWKRFSMFWLVFAFVLPWHDNIMVADFALNYLLSGFLTMFFLLMLFENERVGVVGLLLGLAAGWSHEGVSVPVLAGLTFLLAMKRMRLSHDKKMLSLAYLLGAVVAVSSPGLWSRAVGSVSAESIGLIGLARTAVLTFPAACVLFGLLGFCFATGRWRKKAVDAWHDNVVLLAVAVTAVTYAIIVATGASFRGAFFAELLCVVSFFRIFVGRVGRMVAATGYLLLSFFYGGIIYWQACFFCQSELIHENISKSGGPVFVPMLEYAPWYTMGQVADSEWRNPIQYMALNRHGDTEGTGSIVVLPDELSDFEASAAKELSGNCGAVIYKGHVLVPASPVLLKKAASQPYGGRWLHAGFQVTTVVGRRYGVYASLRGFEDKNGRLWFLMSPDRGYWCGDYLRLELEY